MPVYVDSYSAPFRGMIMCHMMADTHDELLAIADRIGVSRRWIQHPGTLYEHFDICLSKRRLAVAEGGGRDVGAGDGQQVGGRAAGGTGMLEPEPPPLLPFPPPRPPTLAHYPTPV